MQIFIPTSTIGDNDFTNMSITKGQLYNLDKNEFITFQFNPENFVWSQEINWANITWKGNLNGGTEDFINIQPTVFELPLLFVADPGSPDIAYNVDEILSNSLVSMDFEEVEKMFKRWNQPIDGLNRPSRVRVIFGPRYFDIVFTSLKYRTNYMFPDLTTREGIVTLGCREWLLPQ